MRLGDDGSDNFIDRTGRGAVDANGRGWDGFGTIRAALAGSCHGRGGRHGCQHDSQDDRGKEARHAW